MRSPKFQTSLTGQTSQTSPTSLTFLFFAALILGACTPRQDHPPAMKDPPPSDATAPVPQVTTASSPPPAPPGPWSRKTARITPAPAGFVPPSRVALKPGQVVAAIGDVHGDLAALRGALTLAGALDTADHWAGGGLAVVITGDYLDRGDDEKEILELLPRLQREAAAAGGALHVLTGNHELLNAQGEFCCLSKRGETALDLVGATRRQRFAPGGDLARTLADRPFTLILGRTVFVHGGILTSHVTRDLDALNRAAAQWLRGERPRLPFEVQSLVWTRYHSLGTPTDEVCDELASTLALVDADRMVVGHTVQKTMNAACDGLVWRIDIGLSRHYGSNGPEVLIIDGDRVTVRLAPKTP